MGAVRTGLLLLRRRHASRRSQVCWRRRDTENIHDAPGAYVHLANRDSNKTAFNNKSGSFAIIITSRAAGVARRCALINTTLHCCCDVFPDLDGHRSWSDERAAALCDAYKASITFGHTRSARPFARPKADCSPVAQRTRPYQQAKLKVVMSFCRN